MKQGELLIIRADANKYIGMGHVMRCLTIARAANELGVHTLFLCADDNATQFLKEQGQAVRVLHTDYDDMEGELPALFCELDEVSGCTCLLLDSYQTTGLYVEALRAFLTKKNIKLALMEDAKDSSYQADTLINYNICADDWDYSKNAEQILLGCTYTPIRPVFAKQEYVVKDCVRHILVTTGGSDSFGIAKQLAKRLVKYPEYHTHIVCGKFSESLPVLQAMETQHSNLTVYTDVKEMWNLMKQCDIAISAAGTTLYELCAVGVPTICFSVAENQVVAGNTFAEKTPMCYAGDYVQLEDGLFVRILEVVQQWSALPVEERRNMSDRLRNIVDGKGAERIVSRL